MLLSGVVILLSSGREWHHPDESFARSYVTTYTTRPRNGRQVFGSSECERSSPGLNGCFFVKKADQLIADADHQFIPLNTADQDPILF